MRLVAWNTNYNNNRRAFEGSANLLADFDADILVLSEVAHPATACPGRVEWIGMRSPGLVVIARNGLSVWPNLLNDQAPENFAAFTVEGRVTFVLLAAWPVARPYHQVLMDGLDLFAPATSVNPRILAGDLNTSSRVRGQEQTHPRFIAHAEEFGLSSVYHSVTGEAYRAETTPTYFHNHQYDNPCSRFHIDYCLVSRSLLPAASLEIQDGPEWRQCLQSDHLPLVLDIPDARLAPRLLDCTLGAT